MIKSVFSYQRNLCALVQWYILILFFCFIGVVEMMNQNGVNNPNMSQNNMMNDMSQNNMMMNQMGNQTNQMGNQTNQMDNQMNSNMGQNPMMNQMNNPNVSQNQMMNQNMMNDPKMIWQMAMQMAIQRQMQMKAILKGSENQNKDNQNNENGINNQQLQNNFNNMVTDGLPNFAGMKIDGKYLREQEDNYSIDDILKEMNLNKEQFYIAVNTRIRQLAKEIQNATRKFENKKQQNPSDNNQSEQVAIVKKMEAVRDLSRIIKFYFKEQSEKDAKQCRDYTNMDFDGLNGWIPAYTDLNGQNHPGRLSFWDPINHSAIDITEDELAKTDIPFLGHDNKYLNCWFNAFNSMISHIPSFYLYFLRLGNKISVKPTQEQDDIKNKFPLSYEIAMYMKQVNDSEGSSKQYHETFEFAQKVVKILPLAPVMNDVDDYKTYMMQTLNNELGISVSKNLPQSSEITNVRNSISVYTCYDCVSKCSSPIHKMFFTTSINKIQCKSDQSHTFVTFSIAGDAYKLENSKDEFGKNPTLNKILTHFYKKNTFTGDYYYCTCCGENRDADCVDSAQLFSSESTLTVISIQPEKQAKVKNSVYTEFSANYPRQIKNSKKMPAFVKSGNNYFELISIGTHLDDGYNQDGNFDAAHWVSYVKDVKNNQWHFCDDKNVDKNFVDSNAKHEQFVTDDINQILQNTSKNGANYVYKKCDKTKYDCANENIKEDISELAFDKNGKGITKSPLYLISAKAKNYVLQKDNPSDEDFKSAVGSFKNRLQDKNVGILDQNGQIKQELISDNQNLIIDNDLNGNINNASNIYDNKIVTQTEYTTGRKAVFIFSGIFAVAATILAIIGAILTIKICITICIIATILAVCLFLAGCFYNQLKEAVNSCLPGGGSENGFENNLEKENGMDKFMSKDGTEHGDDPYNNPEINNGNPFYK